MRAEIIEMADALEMTVYIEEIEQVVHMSRRDQGKKMPGPVLVTLSPYLCYDSKLV